ESVTLRSTVTNILADADNVTMTVEVVSPANISLTQNNHNFGAMAEKQSAVTPNGKFVLQIPSDVLPDTRIVLKTTVTTADRSNVAYLEFVVFPTWGTTALNNIAISFNSVGNVGHATNREEGIGFYYGDEGSLIWHGGLMIGTSETKLPDVVRIGASDRGTGRGFQLKEPYRLSRDDANSVETGRAVFTDLNNILGIEVTLTTIEYDNENYVLLFYDVANKSNTRLDNLFCGLYLDWDLTPEGTKDHASWDGERKMGFVRHTIPSVPTPTTGIALLSDQAPNYYAANSQGDDSYILTDFTDARKWNMLSRGVSKENNPTTGTVDASMTIGGGPVAIEPGENATFVFAMMAANDFTTLQETADKAQEQYDFLATIPQVVGTNSGIEFSLLPTLFSEETNVLLNLRNREQIRVEVFNIAGEKVGTIYDGMMSAGTNRVVLNLADKPSGTYIVRVLGEAGVVEKKGIVVR
ncbi:MAG: T9SS type A sorting domain-containing protein, partial [Candidatus Kapaibacterium sp.]